MNRWMRTPVAEPISPQTVWEHTPLDYYRYGEYPRFLRPVGAHQPRTEQKLIDTTQRKGHDS